MTAPDLSTAWRDLLPHVHHAAAPLRRWDVDGEVWLSDGFIGVRATEQQTDLDQYPEGGERGVDSLRSMLAWERRQLIVTDKVVNDRWQAVSVLHDGGRPVHVAVGQLARLCRECPPMWTTDEDGNDVGVKLAWMLAIHPDDLGRSAVLVESADGPIGFVMPLKAPT